MNSSSIDSKKDHETVGKYEAEIRILKNLLQKVSAHAEELEAELDLANKKIKKLHNSLRQCRTSLDSLYASRSWRLTLPVRMVSSLARSIFHFLSPFHRAPGKRDNPPTGLASPDHNIPTGQKSGSASGIAHRHLKTNTMSPRETETCKQLMELISKREK